MPRKSKRKIYLQKMVEILKSIRPYWLFTIGFIILIFIAFIYLLFTLKGSHHPTDETEKMTEETSQPKINFNFYSSLPNMAAVPAPEGSSKKIVIGNPQELERDISQHLIQKKERK